MTDSKHVFEQLQANRRSPVQFPDSIAPGVYAMFVTNLNCLQRIEIPASGLIYVGLSKRLADRNHFHAASSGFHSPRRSLGALLKQSLSLTAIPRSSGPSASNTRNYSFQPDGEARLTQWMLDNLEYAIYAYPGNVSALEKDLIRDYEPPINLTGWKNPQKSLIQSLRKDCQREAASHAVSIAAR